MYNDLRFALRMILTHRLFSIAVIVTMALGIGVNTTVFTLVNAVLYKPVPVPNGDRLVVVVGQNLNRAGSELRLSYPDYRDIREQSTSFDELEAVRFTSATISEETNPPEQLGGAWITVGLFDMIDTAPILGRGFVQSDGGPGANPVFLISYDVWQSRYGGEPEVLGRMVRLNGKPSTLIGIMPPEFQFPSDQKLWMPLVETEANQDRKIRNLAVYGLIKPGATLQSAGADVATIAHRIAADYPDENKDITAGVFTFHEAFNGGQVKTIFLVMLGAVGFVLLIACANVASLLIGRAITRQHEISVRTSLGAARWQLIRQLLIECILLSTLGGLLGLGIAALGTHAFDLATRNVGKPYWILFEMDFRVFVYFAAICIISGVMFGLMPALKATRSETATALKDSGRGLSSTRSGKLTTILVVMQFALTAVLLSGAGLMVRSYLLAQSINSFIPADKFFSVRVQLPSREGERYEDTHKRLEFYETLLDRVTALPGVVDAAATSSLPGLGASDRRFEIEGRPQPVMSEAPFLSFIVQSNDYFRTIGLPLLQGEAFDGFVREDGPKEAVVTQTFAQHYWPGEPAIGKRFRIQEGDQFGDWILVRGICADLDQQPMESDFRPLVFFPHQQHPWGGLALMVKSEGDATALARPIRQLVQQLDEDLALRDVYTLKQALNRGFWFLNVFGTLFLSFAVIGLVIAAVGIYGVMSQATASRTREIGIRMALGASSGRVLHWMIRKGVLQLAVGLVLGISTAVFTNRLMSTFTFSGVSAAEPLVLLMASAVIVVTGMVACWIPSQKASRQHPATALRED